jgi:hypothetical protein
MYGAVLPSGVAVPDRVTSQLGDVVAVTNQSRDRGYDVTGELRKQTSMGDVSVSVSFGRIHDVQSPRAASALLTDNWRFARPVSGRENDLLLGISDFDQPFRVRASGTVHSPWQTLRTDVTFFYVGGSGFPYTYVAGGTQGRGDLNADGVAGNDPIYIPRNAFDTTEVRFAGTAAEVATQKDAFERFVDGASCLDEQRGQIMSRNSCRTPWMSLTNLAIRQSLSSVGEQALAFELQIFNVLNLLNSRWGRVQLPTGSALSSTNQIPLLSQVGETAGPKAQPIYRFDSTMLRYSDQNFDTYYQIQLALRYTF